MDMCIYCNSKSVDTEIMERLRKVIPFIDENYSSETYGTIYTDIEPEATLRKIQEIEFELRRPPEQIIENGQVVQYNWIIFESNYTRFKDDIPCNIQIHFKGEGIQIPNISEKKFKIYSSKDDAELLKSHFKESEVVIWPSSTDVILLDPKNIKSGVRLSSGRWASHSSRREYELFVYPGHEIRFPNILKYSFIPFLQRLLIAGGNPPYIERYSNLEEDFIKMEKETGATVAYEQLKNRQWYT